MAWRLRSAAKFDFYTVLHEPALEDGQVRHTQAQSTTPKHVSCVVRNAPEGTCARVVNITGATAGLEPAIFALRRATPCPLGHASIKTPVRAVSR